MTDDNREHSIRVNDTDTAVLKAAKSEFATPVPLGYVARVGAQKILEENDDSEEVTIS